MPDRPPAVAVDGPQHLARQARRAGVGHRMATAAHGGARQQGDRPDAGTASARGVAKPGRLRVLHARRCAGRRQGRGAAHRAGLPRALPGARGDGADQLHRASGRRPRRGLGADPGAGFVARHRGACRRCGRKRRDGARDLPRRRFSGAASKWTTSARRCASRSKPAAARCNCCGRARKTSPTTSTARPVWR